MINTVKNKSQHKVEEWGQREALYVRKSGKTKLRMCKVGSL